MSIPCDYHMHTRFSSDGTAPPEEMCEAALRAGLREICFTEHVDWHEWDPTRGFFEPEAYVPAVLDCRARYAGRLAVRLGVEVGEPHLVDAQLKALLAAWPLDFVLGSVHWIDNSGLFFSQIYDHHAPEQAERMYFQRVLELARGGDFDSLGHLDLVRRYRPKALGPFDPAPHAEAIRAILGALIERGRAFEINTSPLRKGLDRTCPDLTVLRWYRELGGERLTVGSDAHTPQDIGAGFGVAKDLLAEAGFTRILRFERRVSQWVDL